MQKNKIEGVKPFNEFWFKSCYYHQLIAGLSCLGISRDAVLMLGIEGAGKDFTVNEREDASLKASERSFGYRCKPCNITKKTLIRSIDRGRPIIVGIDQFYQENRPDTYHKVHGVHFILVYGYDLERGEVDITDHDYVNSYVFREKKMSLDNLLAANKYYRRKGKSRRFTCRRIYKKEGKAGRGKSMALDEERVSAWQKNSEENLTELKRLFASDREALQEKTLRIKEYLREVKQQFLCVSCLEGMETSERDRVTAMDLFNGYSNLNALLWKMFNQKDYEYAAKHLDSILRKIDGILAREKEFYALLLRCCI